ncbi:twin-arginine translocase TatA/TatE family subunit [Pseudomonas sp. App30]|uniref:twin-arginine translocase TatA/TatE family subunit n=1 Tax=Pseudomonas sp. App30 TaxID=3068990 RepID=UPI003A802AB1
MGLFDWKHWIVILIVVVLVFGTKKLKNLGTDVGESIKGFRKAMNDDEKPADQPVPPAQPVHPQATSPLSQPHTIDATAQKVEDPIRKD